VEHPYEYTTLLHFMPYQVITGPPDYKSVETQGQIMQVVQNFVYQLPKVITEKLQGNWEVNSHNIAFAPDGTIMLSILLQRRRT